MQATQPQPATATPADPDRIKCRICGVPWLTLPGDIPHDPACPGERHRPKDEDSDLSPVDLADGSTAASTPNRKV